MDCGSNTTINDSINLDWLHHGLVAHKKYAIDQMYNRDSLALIERKKLRLVLDLDETLVHCIQMYEDFMDEENVYREAQVFPENRNWVKFSVGHNEFVCYLRPGVLDFLNTASMYYEIYIYTHGTTLYATKVLEIVKSEMARMNYELKIHGVSARTTQHRLEKKLSSMMCKRSITVVVDDNPSVWCTEDQESIIKVSPYKGKEDDDELEFLFEYLKTVHQEYFEMKHAADVRHVLKSLSE